MPLSEHEQRVLEQMERALTSDDPRLASTLQSSRRTSGWRYVLAGLAVIAGLVLLVLGVAMSMVWLGAVGFGLMFAGVWMVVQKPRGKASLAVVAEDGTVRQAPAKRPARRSLFTRLEERWERRRGQEGR